MNLDSLSSLNKFIPVFYEGFRNRKVSKSLSKSAQESTLNQSRTVQLWQLAILYAPMSFEKKKRKSKWGNLITFQSMNSNLGEVTTTSSFGTSTHVRISREFTKYFGHHEPFDSTLKSAKNKTRKRKEQKRSLLNMAVWCITTTKNVAYHIDAYILRAPENCVCLPHSYNPKLLQYLYKYR